MDTPSTKPTGLPEMRQEDAPAAPDSGQAGNRAKLDDIRQFNIIRKVQAMDELAGIKKRDNSTQGEVGRSTELPQDDLMARLSADGRIVDPPFDKLVLAMLPEQSTALGPVIEAMVQNCEGFGHRLECRVKLDDPECPEDLKTEVLRERTKISNFFNNCCPDYSFTELRRRTRHDIEATGEAFWEVIRNPNGGEIVALNHLPSHQMRLGPQDADFTLYSRQVAMLKPDGSVALEPQVSYKRFRRFLQARTGGMISYAAQAASWQVRWFKEYGDTRTINNRTGDEVKGVAEINAMSEMEKANEILHLKLYSPRTPYGLPRHIGNLVTVFGDRAADEINYVTLKNNNIPSMIVMVSNGQLTQGSIDRMQQFVETQVQGSANYSRFLIIEGEGAYDGPDTGHVKLDIKPMTQEQMRDQLFQDYSKNNRDKIREAFRMPPIFVGGGTDYSKATAESSRRLADEQVFKPERDEFDTMINKQIMVAMGARFHIFKSNGPNVTDDADLIQILATAERTGGLTPRITRMILSDILGREDLPAMDPSINLDIPFSIQLAGALKTDSPAGTDASFGAVNSGGAAVNDSGKGVPEAAKKAMGLTRDSMISQLLELRDGLEVELNKRLGDRWKDEVASAAARPAPTAVAR